jgi:transcriptional regulator with XRE-family HTH domain
VRARRLELGMTQQELSDASTVSVSCISAYENDGATPRKQNQRLIVDALGGTWPGMYDDPPASGIAPSSPAEILGREKGCPDRRERCVLGGELERIAASSDATVVVIWVDEQGALEASGRDNCLLVIRACVTPATLKDVMRLRALVDRLEEQLRGHGQRSDRGRV